MPGMKKSGLPRIRTWAQYRRVFGKTRIWMPAMRAILARHGFSLAKVTAVFPGTCIVFMARTKEGKDVVVKLYAPVFRQDARTEETALAFLAKRTRLYVPRVLASGALRDRQAWPYLILKPIEGVAMRDVFKTIPRREAEAVAAELGRFVRAMHRASRDRFRLPGPKGAAWGSQSRRLILATFAKCRKLPIFRFLVRDGLCENLRRFVRSGPGLVPVLVNGDITEDHVMVVKARGRWRLSGVIDFGDSRRAHAGYELFPLWFGALARRPNLLKRYLGAYSPALRISRAWLDSATAFCLLQEFGPAHIAHLLERDRVSARALTWDRFRSWMWSGRMMS